MGEGRGEGRCSGPPGKVLATGEHKALRRIDCGRVVTAIGPQTAQGLSATCTWSETKAEHWTSGPDWTLSMLVSGGDSVRI